MNIERMRQIDYFLGIPLLFFISLGSGIKSLWKRPSAEKPRRILFLELSEMGSAILAEPAMKKAKQQFQANLYFCIFQRNADCLKLLGLIEADHIFLIRDDTPWHFILDSFRFRRWSHQHAIDTLIDLELFSRFSALLTAWSGVSHRVGFQACHSEGLYRGNVYNHHAAYNPHHHIAHNYLMLVHQLCTRSNGHPYAKIVIGKEALQISPLTLQASEQQRVLQKLTMRLPKLNFSHQQPLVINVNRGGLIAQRSWPRGHFVTLIKQLLSFDPRAVILLSGADDAVEEADTLMKLVNSDRCFNIAGLFQIVELPYLYHLAKLMVSSDSGPAHFAAVTDMPVVALFGPETPALYHPLGKVTVLTAQLACSPCISAANHRKTSCRDNQCMQMITPEQVFAAIRNIHGNTDTIRMIQKQQV